MPDQSTSAVSCVAYRKCLRHLLAGEVAYLGRRADIGPAGDLITHAGNGHLANFIGETVKNFLRGGVLYLAHYLMDLKDLSHIYTVIAPRGDHQRIAANISHRSLHLAHRLLHVGRLFLQDVGTFVDAILGGLTDNRLGKIRTGHVDYNSRDSLAQSATNGSEGIALAGGFAAGLPGGDYFGSFGIDQPVVYGDHGFILILAGGDSTNDTADNAAAADVSLLVVATEDDNVAGEHRVSSGNLTHPGAASLLHAIAGVEVLLLHQSIDFGALHHHHVVGIRDALDQHGANPLADVLLRAEDRLHGGHDCRVIEFVHDHALLLSPKLACRGSRGGRRRHDYRSGLGSWWRGRGRGGR